jgi:uncharacterized protein
MKHLLLWLIRLYWKRPNHLKKGKCHFKESCSHYVYRTTQEQGFKAGVIALKERYHQCRPFVAIIQIDNEDFVLFQNKTIIERSKTNI